MKSDLNIKILKLSIAEIVMQSGFERISEQALNILGDLFKFYSEQILLKIKKMNKDHSFSINYLVNEFSLPSHQITELISFLNTQLSLKKSLGVKEEDESLLHTLKVIPKSVDLSNVFRNTSSFNLNLSFKNGSSNLNLELDLEMEKFIKENLKNKKGKEKEKIEYKFNLIEIIKDIRNDRGGGGVGVVKGEDMGMNKGEGMGMGGMIEKRKVFRR